MTDVNKLTTQAGTTHGARHDDFPTQAADQHGGSWFDENFGSRDLSPSDPRGRLFDEFPSNPGGDRYGERFDDFGWIPVPGIHGQLYDSDFRTPIANQTGHATWFDAFRGGTQVRYMNDGADYEGVIIECTPQYAVVRNREGQVQQVGLSQFLEYRTPNDAHVTTAAPDSDSQRPSTQSRRAMGGGPRTPIDANAAVSSTVSNKTHSWDESQGIFKAVDTTATAIQSQDVDSNAQKRCQKCGSSKVGKSKCKVCGTKVTSVGKATTFSFQIFDNGPLAPSRVERLQSDGSQIPKSPGPIQPANGAPNGTSSRPLPAQGGPQNPATATAQGQPKRRKKQGQKRGWDQASKTIQDTLTLLKAGR